MTEFWILDGHEAKPVATVEEWARQFDSTMRRVAVTDDGEVTVSTVFLGINHAWDGGPPLLFETMVFGGPLDGEQERYTTWDEALTGHDSMVARAIPASQRGT